LKYAKEEEVFSKKIKKKFHVFEHLIYYYKKKHDFVMAYKSEAHFCNSWK